MKIVSTKKMVNGNVQIVLNAASNELLMPLYVEAFYRPRGQANGQVIDGETLALMERVQWNTTTQEWVAAEEEE